MLDITKIERKELINDFINLYAERNDMQGLITRGYKKLHAATYLLLEIDEDNPAGAKEYFTNLADCFLSSAGKDLEDNASGGLKEAVNIAFTSSGLRKLKLDKAVIDTFSREFNEGISYNEDCNTKAERPVLLGDVGRNDPKGWQWGNKKNPVDCMVLLYAKNGDSLKQLIENAFTRICKGVKEVYTAKTFTYDDEDEEEIKEHFGFRDGISQPIIKGLSKSDNREYDEQMLINAGEFILGHKNEYNNYSPCPYTEEPVPDLPDIPGKPGKKNLGMNGTYLVFRQIEQHVEHFWTYMLTHSKESGKCPFEKAVQLASKMIGRKPDGEPMVKRQHKNGSKSTAALNDFLYAGEPWDEFGKQCPLGAHIRRTNPRNQVHTGRGEKDSLEMSKRHRMLRRGRVYGEPLDTKFDIQKMIAAIEQQKKTAATSMSEQTKLPTRGLHFICLVSDIARQFEFVQNVWANTPTFADLSNETDPIISPRYINDQQQYDEFTAPNELLRNRYTKVPEFTTVVGGGYFFLPGIKALRYIINQ